MVKKRNRIGLLVDYITSEYTSLLIQGAQKACKELNVELIILPIGELHNISIPYDYQCEAIASLVNKNNVDGIIISSGTQIHYLSKEEFISFLDGFSPVPVVNISTEIKGYPSIVVECYNAYKEIVTELVKNQGCKKFGVIGVRSEAGDVRLRLKHLNTIFEEMNIGKENVYFWKSNFDYATTLSDLNNYYNENNSFDFDAIFAMNDEMAFACIDFCREKGFEVPKDICVIGFDDIARCSYSIPTLSTITQDIANQAYSSVFFLNSILEGKSKEMVKFLEAKPIFRDSTKKKKYKPSLLENTNVIVEDISQSQLKNTFSATEWYEKKAQLYHITRYYTDMQTEISVNQFKARVNDDLRSFGLKACAIVVYQNPIERTTPFDAFELPHKAELLSAFDYSTGYDSKNQKKKIVFDPNVTLYPEGVLCFTDEPLYAASLYHNTLQFGYILFRPGSYDIAIYDLLNKFLSTVIASVYSYTKVQNEKTKFKAKYNKLDNIARTDELTGLLNRRGLYDIGKTTLEFAQSMSQSGIIVYCDMDGLKKINDSYGHEAGDRAIAAEAGILKKSFRSNDVVARIGGDEFAIISPGLSFEVFERTKAQIQADCKVWSKENNTPYTLSISMGAVAYPSGNDGYSIISLLAEADNKLYEEKNSKKSAKK